MVTLSENMIRVRWWCVCWILVTVWSGNHSEVYGRQDGQPVPEFSQHRIVKPRLYHGREKREIATTRQNDGHAHDITVGFDIGGKDYILELKLNRDLIPSSYFEKYHHQGQYVINTPTNKEIELCHYQGKLIGVPDSWAAVSTCYGLSGVVYDGRELHYLERIPGENRENLHFLYSHSDLRTNHTCGYSGTPHHIMADEEVNRILRYKRTPTETIRGPYNANKKSRYVELVLVVDNKQFQKLGDLQKTYNRCKDIANIVNSLFVPLNIYIALVGVVVWNVHDEIALSVEGDATLTKFLQYRRERLVKEHPNDNAQLLTGIQFSGGVVGKALKGPICTYEFSGGVNMDHSDVVGLVATTVAHELGHNFGMEHDSDECQCPLDRCIMAPSSSQLSPTHWSSCSLEYLALAFEHGMDYCLRNKPQTLFDGPVCGNGFVEPGEQCDCGLPERCENYCCNATTCMLHSNATCATGECCDLLTCKPKQAGSVCRGNEHECDLPEYCTGESEFCPPDVFKIDGETCRMGKAFCYQGSCRTHSDQCKLLWGPSGKNSDDECYAQNNKGTKNGNCGYQRLNQSFIKCQEENRLCGMLHCSHLNERLEFGMESVAILSHTFINTGGRIIPCRSAIVDLGLNEMDPGLAPDGARCASGKMCVNQKCMPVASLQKGGCPYNCNKKGICNSKGRCHCEVGFAPPYCEYPGPGGSEDSGPASDPNGSSEFVTALYVVLLGVVPVLAVGTFLAFYSTRYVDKWCKRKPPHVSQTKSSQHKPPPRCRPPSFKSDTNGLRKVEISHPICSDPAANDGATATLLPKLNNDSSANSSPAHAADPQNNGFAPTANIFGHYKGFSLTPLSNESPPKPRPSSGTETEAPTTLSRIASFLRHNPELATKSNGRALPQQQNVKAAKIDRDSLRTLQISNPILQSESAAVPVRPAPPPPYETEPPSYEDAVDGPKVNVVRTQSLRDGVPQKRTNVPNFGSLRGKRPTSVVPPHRPKSPPPRPPPPKPHDSEYFYDDCMNLVAGTAPLADVDEETSPSLEDNIYAVIDEVRQPKIEPTTDGYVGPTPVEYQVPKPVTSASGSTESMGLLSEIVGEIQARNLESIYTSTLGRNKKNKKSPEETEPSKPQVTSVSTAPSTATTSVSSAPTTASQSKYKPGSLSGTLHHKSLLSSSLSKSIFNRPALYSNVPTNPTPSVTDTTGYLPTIGLGPRNVAATTVDTKPVVSTTVAKPTLSTAVTKPVASTTVPKPVVAKSAVVKPGLTKPPAAVTAKPTVGAASKPTVAPVKPAPVAAVAPKRLSTFKTPSTEVEGASKEDDRHRPAPSRPSSLSTFRSAPAVPKSAASATTKSPGAQTSPPKPKASIGEQPKAKSPNGKNVRPPNVAASGRSHVASLQQKFETSGDLKRTSRPVKK